MCEWHLVISSYCIVTWWDGANRDSYIATKFIMGSLPTGPQLMPITPPQRPWLQIYSRCEFGFWDSIIWTLGTHSTHSEVGKCRVSLATHDPTWIELHTYPILNSAFSNLGHHLPWVAHNLLQKRKSSVTSIMGSSAILSYSSFVALGKNNCLEWFHFL